MRFAGIDIGSRSHVVAIVIDDGAILLRPTPFAANWAGHESLFRLLGAPVDIFVAMEATGHYSRNLFRALADRNYAVALINPLRTRRFAEEDLMRAKTDSVDALAIARFAAQKRPAPTQVDTALDQLRELVCFYNRILQDYNARLRQLYRLVNLCFPEFIGPAHARQPARRDPPPRVPDVGGVCRGVRRDAGLSPYGRPSQSRRQGRTRADRSGEVLRRPP